MFPTTITNADTSVKKNKVISTSSDLGKTPSFDWITKTFVLSDGTPKLIYDVEAIKQWIILFIKTPRDIYKIYAGTGFGTSIRKLYGRKTLNNGYEEAQIERELREGLPLCPAIKRVTSFNMHKKGRIISVYVQVELFDGILIDETVEGVYTIKW